MNPNQFIARFMERREKAAKRGLQSLWYMLFANTVLELFAEGRPVTTEIVRERLQEFIKAADRGERWSPSMKDVIQQAIDVLDDNAANPKPPIA